MENIASVIKYSIKIKSVKEMCDVRGIGDYVKAFKVVAHLDDKVVGEMKGNLFDMMNLLETGKLVVFDETATTERLYTMMYHGSPMALRNSDVAKGFKPEFVNFINSKFADVYDTHDHEDFDEMNWPTHYMTSIGFVENIEVEESFRGQGIGSAMMSMLRKLSNRVDYMVLQSYPNTMDEHVRKKGLSFEEEDEYTESPAYKKLFKKEQKKVDNFYKKLGFVGHQERDFQWMVIDQDGLNKMPKLAKESIIKHKKKKARDDSFDFK